MNAIADVAIGLIFMYLLLSLMCTAVSEMIASKLSLRSKNLHEGLKKLLNDKNGQGLYRDVISHPLIRQTCVMIGDKNPSYISARNFTAVLMARIAPAAGIDPGKMFADIEGKIRATQNGAIEEALLALLNDAQGDFGKLKVGISGWNDDAMDRLSGVYKRKVQKILLGLSFGLVVLFNADTIAVSTMLWRDAPLRGEIANAANAATQAKIEDWYAQRYEVTSAELMRFPIGWLRPDGMSSIPEGLTGWCIKILGLLMTTLAVSLGAPFWFDVLQRANAIRSSGPKPRRGAAAEPAS